MLDTFPMVVDETHEDFPDALTAVVRRERTALTRIASREGLNAQDALECVQDALCTFLGLHRSGQLSAPPEEWGPLLAGMVRNAGRNRRRRHYLARPHGPDEERAGVSPGADEVIIQAEAHVRLRVCVAELCEIQRAVVLLRLLEEEPGEDVAHSLGIARGYVDVLTHRAKLALRACMLREATRKEKGAPP